MSLEEAAGFAAAAIIVVSATALVGAELYERRWLHAILLALPILPILLGAIGRLRARPDKTK